MFRPKLTFKSILLGSTLSTLGIVCLGCSNTPLTEEEVFNKEYNVQIDKENWIACEAIYKEFNKPTYHKDHSHTRGRVTKWDIKLDLAFNNCKYLLGDGWADHLTKDKK